MHAQLAPAPRTERLRPFSADLAAELRRLVRPPRAELWVIAANGLMVAAGWLLLPRAARSWLFELQGPLAFAVVLQTWMLADVPATNVLGNDAAAAAAALGDPVRLCRLLRVKTAALACLVGSVSAVAAAAVGWYSGRYVPAAALALVLLAAPFGVLAVSAGVGVLLPYHPRSLVWRWDHRRPWRRTARWAALVVLPYAVVPAIMSVVLGPGIAAGRATHRHDRSAQLTGIGLPVSAVVACALAAAAFAAGPFLVGWLARRRGRWLRGYLTDPERG